ncbi:MAG: glycosyltransferase [Planctomycetota bacterium]|jgi:starch synthase (maltosyl-transferring)
MSSPVPLPICFLITELDIGGAERALVKIATGLPRERWKPSVICLSDRGPLAEPLEEAGIPVTCLGAGRVFSPRGLWQATVGLTRELRRQQPRVLQTFLFHANIAGRVAGWRAGVPRVLSGIRVADRRGCWRLALDRWTERLVDKHVCVSRGVADFCVRESGLSQDKVVVIPNGVDVDTYRSAEPADLSQFGIPSDAEVILAVGRLDPQKDPLTLLQAVHRVASDRPNLHLLFAGDGPLRSDTEAEARRLNIEHRVHLAGWTPDVPRLLKSATLFVLASRWEGMPNVVLEAAAAGVPIIATETEGVREIIEPGRTGTLVKPGDVDGLAQGISTALAEQSLPQAMARTLQQEVTERFTWDSVIAEYDRLYESLVVRRG